MKIMSDSSDVQNQIISVLGNPRQILGGRFGALVLQYDDPDIDLDRLFVAVGAKVTAMGRTPLKRGGPAIIPRAIAVKDGLSVLARGRVEGETLRGIDIILTEPNALGATDSQEVFAFLIGAIEGMPDPEEAFLGLVRTVLRTKFDEDRTAGNQLLGKLLSSLGQQLSES
ncbi:hypothetical protein C7S18_24040 (plasmid) [Ahniella affigens]|uniref:Uncharacterized protein n=2 Tax=Ahniella affigens TaxID=2021234 RepID=A0A2P1PZV3_9GAMM|nr:hypothetical protein C7S18_24040 [Ahniella affigens]